MREVKGQDAFDGRASAALGRGAGCDWCRAADLGQPTARETSSAVLLTWVCRSGDRTEPHLFARYRAQSFSKIKGPRLSVCRVGNSVGPKPKALAQFNIGHKDHDRGGCSE